MKKPKYYAFKNNAYLVQGAIDEWVFDSEGKPYEFDEKDAFYLRDTYDYVIEIVSDKDNLSPAKEVCRNVFPVYYGWKLPESKIVTDSDLALLIQNYYSNTCRMSFQDAEKIANMITEKFEGHVIKEGTLVDDITEAFKGINK